MHMRRSDCTASLNAYILTRLSGTFGLILYNNIVKLATISLIFSGGSCFPPPLAVYYTRAAYTSRLSLKTNEHALPDFSVSKHGYCCINI